MRNGRRISNLSGAFSGLLFSFLLLLVTFSWLPAQAGPPELQKPKGEACIQPTDWMRRNHMDFLKERRELTVRDGVRNPAESLRNCQSCHESRADFCDKCHTYAGVKPDCFECHVYK